MSTELTPQEAYIKAVKDWLEVMEPIVKDMKAVISTEPTDPTDDPTVPVETGNVNPKWTPNPDPRTWRVTKMVKQGYEGLWKLVDDNDENAVEKFTSKEAAEEALKRLIKAYVPIVDPVDPTDPDIPSDQVGPYPTTGKTLKSTQRGPTTRHYRSGKPDDETIEKNVVNIKFDNYQFIVDTTVEEVEHDDNISLKGGGQHNGGDGWYDCGVSFEDGQTCLGTEPHHPTTHLCQVKGPKIGSILNKRIKIALVVFKSLNYIELWTNLENEGWKLQVKGKNVGGLKPDNSQPHECQERIDGFKKSSVPKPHLAIVQELAPEAKPNQ